MTKHDDRLYFGHMLDMAVRARRFTREMTLEQLSGDEVMQHSLVNVLQILGEAARRVSPGGKERFPNIPWSQIIGMRHKLVHDYMDIDYEVIWKTIHEELPALTTMLERVIDQGAEEGMSTE
jgi:uncharacterized protein with HEPN domain